MKKWQHWTIKQRVIGIGLSVVLVVGIGVGSYKVYADHVHQEAKQALKQKLSAPDVTKLVDHLMDDHGFLKSELTQEEIDTAREALAQVIKEMKAYDKKYPHEFEREFSRFVAKQRLLDQVSQKLTLQTQANEWFDRTPALDGIKLTTDVVLVDGVDLETIEQVATEVETMAPDQWADSMMKLVDVGTKQLTRINAAEKAVKACYTDEKVKKNVTKKQYEAAEKAVKTVKRKTDNERLEKQLAEIKKVIDANEKKAKEQAEKEKAEKAEQVAAEAESPSGEATGNAQNPANNGGDNGNAAATNGGSSTVNGGGNYSGTGGSSNGGSFSSGGNSAGSSGGSGNTSGGNNSSGGGNTGGGTSTPPATPQPEKPYALNPYTGGGTYYATYAAATAAARAEAANPNSNFSGYTIYTEIWSDGSEKYYLELY